jgi:hypothetical protein
MRHPVVPPSPTLDGRYQITNAAQGQRVQANGGFGRIKVIRCLDYGRTGRPWTCRGRLAILTIA